MLATILGGGELAAGIRRPRLVDVPDRVTNGRSQAHFRVMKGNAGIAVTPSMAALWMLHAASARERNRI
jgi:hypothetical protein